MNIKETVRFSEAARRLGVSRQRVHQLITNGNLATVTDAAGEKYIPLREIHRYRRLARAQSGPKEEAVTENWKKKRLERLESSAIYFIQRGDEHGAIKIGWTWTDPMKRLHTLQHANDETLTLLGYFPGSCGDEAALHERFAHLRIRGEWFRPDDDLLAFIRDSVCNALDTANPPAIIR